MVNQFGCKIDVLSFRSIEDIFTTFFFFVSLLGRKFNIPISLYTRIVRIVFPSFFAIVFDLVRRKGMEGFHLERERERERELVFF